MSSPKISIVICTYNGEQYLRPQMESLINQSYTNLEILLCDDGSTDATLAIAHEFAAKDNRIRIHQNPQNLGYNKNFEQAFHLAQGEIIAVSDQDDIWKTEKIENMLPLLNSPEIVLAHCQSVRFTDSVPQIERYTLRRQFEGNDARKLMYFNTVAGHNIIFRKKLLQLMGPFPEGVFYDWWLVIGAAVYGNVACTDKVYTFHRFHQSNVTLGRKDEKKQTRSKADERRHTVSCILKMKGLKPEDKQFAEALYNALAELRDKNFSLSLFLFLLRHAEVLLFFKKKSWFSKAKMAYRLSFAV